MKFYRKFPRKSFLDEVVPHLNIVYRVAIRESKNPQLAEDLVQETYKEAWKSFQTLEPKTNPKAWVFKIFFRVLGKHRREKKRFFPVGLESLPEPQISVGGDVDARIENREVLELLDSLPEKYRRVLLLADIEEFSYREISDLLEVPIGTVMSRLSRARSLFRKKYEAREVGLLSA